MIGISVVVHTYNSEKYLERCLESVKSCQEIIVCDQHSTDRTVEIAYRYGSKVIYHKHIGFADPARNFALSYASQEWVLVLDSDEEVPPELLEHLRELAQTLPEDITSVLIPRKNLYLGEVLWITYPNYLLRFFKNGAVEFSEKVHAPPIIKKGKAYQIKKNRKKLSIIHHNYEAIESWIKKMNVYTNLEQEKYREKGIKFSAGLLFSSSIGEFVKKYVFKGGFKQGWYGFVFSSLFAVYKFIAAVKLWEVEFKERKNK